MAWDREPQAHMCPTPLTEGNVCNETLPRSELKSNERRFLRSWWWLTDCQDSNREEGASSSYLSKWLPLSQPHSRITRQPQCPPSRRGDRVKPSPQCEQSTCWDPRLGNVVDMGRRGGGESRSCPDSRTLLQDGSQPLIGQLVTFRH